MEHSPGRFRKKHGHVDEPLEAFTLVVILSVECGEGVMYQSDVDGFEPLRGPILFCPPLELSLEPVVNDPVLVEAGVFDTHVGKRLPHRHEVRLSST